jgi:hypothetical protein
VRKILDLLSEYKAWRYFLYFVIYIFVIPVTNIVYHLLWKSLVAVVVTTFTAGKVLAIEYRSLWVILKKDPLRTRYERVLHHTPPGVCANCLNGRHDICALIQYGAPCRCYNLKHDDSEWWRRREVPRG